MYSQIIKDPDDLSDKKMFSSIIANLQVGPFLGPVVVLFHVPDTAGILKLSLAHVLLLKKSANPRLADDCFCQQNIGEVGRDSFLCVETPLATSEMAVGGES